MNYTSDNSGVAVVADASGNVMSGMLETDAFGVPLLKTAPAVGPPSRSGFAGAWGYEDELGGVHLVGHRWYDADSGRFLTRDPARDGRNWWAYCDNDPVNVVDPTGLFNVIIEFDKNGIGRAKVYADAGDEYWDPGANGGKGGWVAAYQGQHLSGYDYDVSNRTTNPNGDPNVQGSNGPFPDGVIEITGYDPDYSTPDSYLGATFFFKNNPITAMRGTWLHSGKGENWRAKTNGCIRGGDAAQRRLGRLYLRNKGNGNKHRITVRHPQKRPSTQVGGSTTRNGWRGSSYGR